MNTSSKTRIHSCGRTQELHSTGYQLDLDLSDKLGFTTIGEHRNYSAHVELLFLHKSLNETIQFKYTE